MIRNKQLFFLLVFLVSQVHLFADSHQSSNPPLKASANNKYTSPTKKPCQIDIKYFTDIQAGVGFLYFAGVKGNLIMTPSIFFAEPSTINDANGSIDPPQPVRGRIEYNRTPVYTADFGMQLTRWFHVALSSQFQQNIFIRTKPFQFAYNRVNPVSSESIATLIQNHFESNLNLYSLGGKLTFQKKDLFTISKCSITPYLGTALGVGWQAWTRVYGFQSYFNNDNAASNTMTNSIVPFRNQYYANFNYTADLGLTLKPTLKNAKMALKVGCKFIGWGSSRGLGSSKDQNDIFRNDNGATDAVAGTPNIPANRIRWGYIHPVRIANIYSWVPYLGISLEF